MRSLTPVREPIIYFCHVFSTQLSARNILLVNYDTLITFDLLDPSPLLQIAL